MTTKTDDILANIKDIRRAERETGAMQFALELAKEMEDEGTEKISKMALLLYAQNYKATLPEDA